MQNEIYTKTIEHPGDERDSDGYHPCTRITLTREINFWLLLETDPEGNRRVIELDRAGTYDTLQSLYAPARVLERATDYAREREREIKAALADASA